jgi:hypothetical protein
MKSHQEKNPACAGNESGHSPQPENLQSYPQLKTKIESKIKIFKLILKFSDGDVT